MSKNPTPNRVQRVRLEAVVPDHHRGQMHEPLRIEVPSLLHYLVQVLRNVICVIKEVYTIRIKETLPITLIKGLCKWMFLNQDQRSMQVNVGVDPELVVAREAEIMSQAHAAVNAARSELESETSAFRDQVVYLFSMKPNRIHKVLNSALVKWFPRCKLNMPRNLNMLSMWQLKLMERLADSWLRWELRTNDWWNNNNNNNRSCRRKSRNSWGEWLEGRMITLHLCSHRHVFQPHLMARWMRTKWCMWCCKCRMKTCFEEPTDYSYLSPTTCFLYWYSRLYRMCQLVQSIQMRLTLPKSPKGLTGIRGAGTTKLEMVLCQPHQLGHLRIRGLPMDQVVHHQVQTVVVVVAVVVTGVMVPVVIWVDYLHMGLNMLYQFRLDQMSFNSQQNVTYIDLKICVWRLIMCRQQLQSSDPGVTQHWPGLHQLIKLVLTLC